MKILRANGGLGNQIFQIIYLLINSRPGEKLFVDISLFSKIFEKDYAGAQFIASEVLSMEANARLSYFNVGHLLSRSFWKLLNKINLGKKLVIDDYCSRASYFPKEFNYKKFFNLEVDPIYYSKYQIDESSVLIHVRKGDYTNSINSKIYFNCDVEFFQSAILEMTKKVSTPNFFVVSNDNEWVLQNFTFLNDYKIIDLADPVVSFKIMSKFSNFIISNSTFSWWPAMLTKSRNVVVPRKWFLDEKLNKDLYPSHWTQI